MEYDEITLVVKTETPRLQYAVDLIFGTILGVKYSLVNYPPSSNAAIVSYGFPAIADSIVIFNSGLLFEKGVRHLEIETLQKEGASLPFVVWEKGVAPELYTHIFPDIFSAAFFLVTEYERYLFKDFDAHGRYDEDSLQTVKLKIHQKPIIHYWAELLLEKIEGKYGKIKRNEIKFDYQITIDVDAPYKYLHKGFWVTAAGFIKDILFFNGKNFGQRAKAHLTRKDPYDTFAHIFEIVPVHKLIFFFLIGGNAPDDGRFKVKHKRYRRLIAQTAEKGARVGIHPSYDAFFDKAVLQEETGALADVLQRSVRYCRRHFIRYRLPDTYLDSLENGLLYDYTTCLIKEAGFKHGLCVPFRWYDLVAEEETDLTLVPTVFMDRTLERVYENPTEIVKNLIEETKRAGGLFVGYFHNQTIGAAGDWPAGEALFDWTLNKLKEIKK